MEVNKQYQIIRVARKYYELHQGQLEISREEKVSKSTISRMLQKAIELGYVKIKVEYPLESVNEIAGQMKELFQLKDVFITPDVIDDEAITLKDTCRAFADRLDRYIHDECIVGVSWGKTLNCLSEYIDKVQAKNIKVVQLNGGVSKHTVPTGAGRIVDAVGDIALRFFDVQGNIANENLNERVVGLALEDFKDKKYNIAIAVGERKAAGILGALRGGYVNVLYTDEKTAKKVLSLVRESQL